MGCAAMFSLETWISTLAYPLNIAGRPLYSWRHLLFRLRVDYSLGWSLGCFRNAGAEWPAVALHPLFNAPNFRNGATTDKFFLCSRRWIRSSI